MPSIDELRNRQTNSLDNLRNRVEEEKNSGGGGKNDDRFWKPPFDEETGKGFAEIRFLPAPPDEDLPWVKMMRHYFTGPTGKVYFENSLTTIGQNDPVGELNRRLWNSGVDSDKEVARAQKRQTVYFSNVLVVNDKANPENNGKVFLMRYGPKIFSIIENAMYPDPELEDTDPINPFDPWQGANLKLKMVGQRLGQKMVPNYDKSEFDKPSPIGSDEEIERLWNKCYSLQQFVSEDAFKSYSNLRNRLFEVLGPTAGSGVPVVEGWENYVPEDHKPNQENQPAGDSDNTDDDISFGPTPEADQSKEEPSSGMSSGDDEIEDDLEFFENLVKDGDA